jgi:hypothetical protein
MVSERPGPTRSSEERRSAQLLAGLVLLVPCIWLALGWRWHLLVGGNDLSLLLAPAMNRLLLAHGDFDAFLYDPAWLGGSKLRDILGTLPLHRVLARLPLSAVTLLNLTVFFAQVLYGHLAARSARALATLFEPSSAATKAELPIALIAAFAPVLAWRVAYGHVFILLGALALPAAGALVVLARAGQLSMTCCAVLVLALLHALPHVGLQPVVYGIIFGLPLLIGLSTTARDKRRTWWRGVTPLLLALAAALLISLPELLALVHHFAGSDAPRGFRSESFTYSYLVANMRDWLASFPWVLHPSWSGRDGFELHETNYPIGPVLLFGALWPRRGLGLFAWLCAGLALALAFSMNLRPLSTVLVAALPPLDLFRIPARALLPVSLALLPVLLALPLRCLPSGLARRDGWLVPIAVALVALGRVAGEALLWVVVLASVALALRGRAAPSVNALLLLLALASVLGFQQRLLPFSSREQLIERPAADGERAKRAMPELRSPLVRVVSSDAKRTPTNHLYAMGLSSPEGYNLLNARLVRLYCAWLGVPYQAGVSWIDLDPEAAYFPKAAALYNVVARLRTDGRALRLERLPTEGAPLWLSRSLTARASHDELVRMLDAKSLRATAPFVATDPDAQELPAVHCDAPDAPIEYALTNGPVILEARLPTGRKGACPLTLAMTYAGDATAHGRRGATWRPLRTFPAYGALQAMLVPADVEAVQLRIEAYRPIWALLAAALGVLPLGVLFVLARRRAR